MPFSSREVLYAVDTVTIPSESVVQHGREQHTAPSRSKYTPLVCAVANWERDGGKHLSWHALETLSAHADELV